MWRACLLTSVVALFGGVSASWKLFRQIGHRYLPVLNLPMCCWKSPMPTEQEPTEEPHWWDDVCFGMDVPTEPWTAEDVRFWTATKTYQPWKDVAAFFRALPLPGDDS